MDSRSQDWQVDNSGVASWIRWVAIFLLVIGVCFRLAAIDHKIYWHDEVYTSMRAAGFTRKEIDEAIFQNRLMLAPELQQFQQIKPASTATSTLQSLIIEDPQHPPLYFLMARTWMQWFGSSMFASRLLPVLISLVGLPLMYGLAMELFSSQLTALLATTLLALSPFDILFAQTARQYSLLTVMVIGSSWLLLRALRQSNVANWVMYSLSVAIGLYTHPFFALTLAAQGVYVGSLYVLNNQTFLSKCTFLSDRTLSQWTKREWTVGNRCLGAFIAAILAAIVLYSPWIWVLSDHHQRAEATTDWTRVPVGLLYLVKLWLLSFTALFIDLDFGFNNFVTYLFRLPFIILIFVAFYYVYRRTALSTWLFILLSFAIPFLLLAIPDLVIGGKRSAVSRYLISCYPAIQLAVAYLFTTKLSIRKPIWRSIVALSVAASLISCSVSATAKTWWNKDLSYFNADVIEIVNAEAAKTTTVLLSDMGDDYTNMGDLVSLSYHLRPDVKLFLVSSTPDLTAIADQPNVIAFRPSQSLAAAIAQQGWQRTPVLEHAKLWRIDKSVN